MKTYLIKSEKDKEERKHNHKKKKIGIRTHKKYLKTEGCSRRHIIQ